MFKRAMLFLVVIMCFLVTAPALAQDGVESAAYMLTVGEVVAIAAGVAALAGGVGAAIAAYFGGGSLAEMDSQIAGILEATRRNAEVITPLEKLVSGMTDKHIEAQREFAQMIMDAARWVPGAANDEAAALYHEIIDGVPVADKIRDLEAEQTRFRSLMDVKREMAQIEANAQADEEGNVPGAGAGF